MVTRETPSSNGYKGEGKATQLNSSILKRMTGIKERKKFVREKKFVMPCMDVYIDVSGKTRKGKRKILRPIIVD